MALRTGGQRRKRCKATKIHNQSLANETVRFEARASGTYFRGFFPAQAARHSKPDGCADHPRRRPRVRFVHTEYRKYWLGREDSNLRMAESKSDNLCRQVPPRVLCR